MKNQTCLLALYIIPILKGKKDTGNYRSSGLHQSLGRASSPRRYFHKQEGQCDQEHLARIYQEQMVLDHLISFYHEMTGSVDENRCLC